LTDGPSDTWFHKPNTPQFEPSVRQRLRCRDSYRNFAISIVLFFVFGVGLLGSTTLIPQMLQLAFVDCFRILAWLTLGTVPLILLVRHFKPAGLMGDNPSSAR
jgi:hypothetical protein